MPENQYDIQRQIEISKICQYLSSIDIESSRVFNGNLIVDRTARLLYITRRAIEFGYAHDNYSSWLNAIVNYNISLCGNYISKANYIYDNGGGTVIGGGGGNTFPMYKEIISFSGVDTLPISWDADRKARFGLFPNIQMFITDPTTGKLVSVTPVYFLDLAFPLTTLITISTGGQTGIITIS
ncbi:MAG: hypothetical protein JSS67_01350 [Bacteroidetes bacterium]|nr:hypothetical protein [Bacteroidota bacterium]